MKRCKYNTMNCIKYFFGLSVCLVLLYFILGELFWSEDVPGKEYQCELFTAKWFWIKSDGTKEPIDIPGKCDVKRDELVTVEAALPENVEDNMYLCFRSSKQDMRIFVDGVLREEYSKNVSAFGNTSAVVYVFLKLNQDDAGKTITVESRSDSSYSGIFYAIYYGDRMGIWHFFFKQYGSELIIAFLTFFLGFVSIIGSSMLHLRYHRKIELEYLGWGVLLAAIWLITNSVFRQLLFPNISVVNDITFFMIMLLSFPFLIYMNELQKQRYEKLYIITGSVAALNFVICTVFHITHIIDFADTFIIIACICVMTILSIGITVGLDIRKGFIKEYGLVAVGILGACVAACAQIVMYFQRSIVFNGVTMALGLIFLLLVAIINTIREILDMESAKQQAISASEAKARFLAHMSHEIRTPINAVLGMDAMILRESRELPIKEYALDIQNAGQSLLALVNDILDFSKIESGKMELLPEEYDLSSMIHDIFNMISMKAEAKELELQLHVDETLPSRLYGDDVRVRQVLVNLLNNAVKYTPEGHVSLTVSGEKRSDTVILHFAVEDTGIGIRQEDIVKLFVEFERIEERRNRSIEGTGLGMNIVVQLLKMMDSYLDVESVYGEGSQFSFDLEQKIVDEEPIGNLEQRIRQQTRTYSYQAAFTAPDAKVLVVDDNAVNRKVFTNLLKETKLQIYEASGGEECLELVRNNYYDVIFLDHMMPDMDGIEVLRCMKSWEEEYPCRNTPVVVLTANAITGAKEMYLSEGFDAFLSKPIIPDKLEKLLMQFISDDRIAVVTEDLVNQNESGVVSSIGDKELFIEDFPVIAGVDWEYGLLHLKDEKLLQNTIRDCYHLMETDASVLERLCQDIADPEICNQYRLKVHSMKSSAAMIGATFISGVAQMLEYAARDGQVEIIRQITPLFLKEWRELKQKLSFFAESKENETGKKKPVDYKGINEFLRLLSVAMENMDIDAADEIVEHLKQYDYPDEEKPWMEELAIAVESLDGEKIEELRKVWCKQ
ncbi:MAG: response regulator [Lachnospiraceae bacterium]